MPIPSTPPSAVPEANGTFLRIFRSTAGRSTTSSRQMNAPSPTTASTASQTMSEEANQSLSWPFSSISCSEPSPTAMKPSPVQSIRPLCRTRYGGS